MHFISMLSNINTCKPKVELPSIAHMKTKKHTQHTKHELMQFSILQFLSFSIKNYIGSVAEEKDREKERENVEAFVVILL